MVCLAVSPIAPKSAIRHHPTSENVFKKEAIQVPRASRVSPPLNTTSRPQKRWPLPYWRLLPVSLGMAIMFGAVLLGQFAISWVTVVRDDLQYGRPRTFQVDARVGHETGAVPSHFIALNLHGQIEIIELPGGDASQARIYVGPQIYGPGADLVPVTLRFTDSGHTGHPDMLILFQNSQVVFRNVQNTFRPVSP